MGKATDLQQAPYPRVIHGRYCMQAMKAELKPRHSHKIPVGIDELKGCVGIVSGPPPPVCDGLVIEIGYAEKANCVYGGGVSTRAVLKECCQGFEVAEFEGFANIDVDRRSCSVFRGSWVMAIEVNRT